MPAWRGHRHVVRFSNEETTSASRRLASPRPGRCRGPLARRSGDTRSETEFVQRSAPARDAWSAKERSGTVIAPGQLAMLARWPRNSHVKPRPAQTRPARTCQRGSERRAVWLMPGAARLTTCSARFTRASRAPQPPPARTPRQRAAAHSSSPEHIQTPWMRRPRRFRRSCKCRKSPRSGRGGQRCRRATSRSSEWRCSLWPQGPGAPCPGGFRRARLEGRTTEAAQFFAQAGRAQNCEAEAEAEGGRGMGVWESGISGQVWRRQQPSPGSRCEHNLDSRTCEQWRGD